VGRRHDTISFLTDYGLADEFVGVCKSVIRGIAPEVAVVDITHDIPPHDIRAGALTLVRAVQYLAPGVALAVVDPGVGTSRRAVAIEVGEPGQGDAFFVGPDNGLLAAAVAMVGGATRAVELANPGFQLPAPGATFAGRDVFAPAAAHLCLGVPLEELGPQLDPLGLVPGLVPLSRTGPAGELLAEVLWVDRFGNAQLNVGPDDVADLGDRVSVRAGDDVRTARRVGAYQDLGPGEVGLVVDSYGLLALSLDRASAADLLRLGPGTGVTLTAAG
jgi:S-adenosylmethionine hydrolase